MKNEESKMKKLNVISKLTEITIDDKGCEHRKILKVNHNTPLPTRKYLEEEHKKIFIVILLIYIVINILILGILYLCF